MSAVYLPYISEQQHRPAGKWSRPFGLRPKYGQSALLVVHLESLNFSPRALPGRFWGSNAGVSIVLTGPRIDDPVKVTGTIEQPRLAGCRVILK